jgi:hypothetical protein
MLFKEKQICELVEETWGSLLEQGLTRTSELPAHAEGYYSCSVEFGSGWGGLLSLDLSRPLAQALAIRMFGRDPEELDPADVPNAVGELTNMVAGGINGWLSEPAQLSLPAVTEDLDHVDYRLRHANCVVLHDIAYDCDGEPLRVTLVRRTAHKERGAVQPAAGGEMEKVAAVSAFDPAEVETGEGLISEAEDLLAQARAEADQILIRARADARRLRAENLEDGAGQGDADALREDARRYALEVLGNLESYTTQMLESVRKSRDWLKSQ